MRWILAASCTHRPLERLSATAESGPPIPRLSMHFQIHQYYGAFGFSLAIVTEKPYNDFQVRKC
ncbi:hypothetical protein AM571_CH01567 [Rhizobium etli 8C-3]|uniref:Uncharacterized protein n=1 Tax=Rhizobium etli 8C-3 TaxID=538025 RepID=A0A1L5P2L2_RHIET|nr:hypothetical protein AM571_CH01567 [Rhizobium etli 8C-3]